MIKISRFGNSDNVEGKHENRFAEFFRVLDYKLVTHAKFETNLDGLSAPIVLLFTQNKSESR